jgi:dipeptidyl aminopeptidase/acylaminoacyl peptidase
VRCILAFFALAVGTSIARADTLQTVAEKTDYTATSRYADVMAFCDAIAKRGPLARLSDFGSSVEGRKLPLLVIADPPIPTPEAAKQSGKLIVLAFANIHAGEVDGKEALLMLARELTDKPGHPLLKDLVILLVPILNADGNERIDPKNRPGDKGPSQGAGIRENAQEFDLNRDFVKLESNEIRALVKLINAWDPAVIIDCHTTNGSKHRHTLTYDGPRYLCEPLESWALQSLFPAVTKRVKETTGFVLAPYGNFSQDRTKWETYPASPRFGVQYFALRQRVGILSESYSYASFKDRVLASLAFVKACFETAAAEKATIRKLIARDAADAKRVTLKTSTAAYRTKLPILGYEEELKNGRRAPTEQHKSYELEWLGQVKPELSVKMPFAYLIPAKYSEAIATIRRHGVAVEELREDITLDVEAYQVISIDFAVRAFQKHKLMTVGAKSASGMRKVPAGTVLVKTDQPLGTLAAYLLEPECEDGLTTWGYFIDGLAPGSDFPVLRLPKAYPLSSGPVAPLPGEDESDAPAAGLAPAGRGAGFAGALQGRAQGGQFGQWLDGESFLQEKEGKLWKCDARTGKVEPFIDQEAVKKSLSALKEVTASMAERMARGTSFRFTPDHTGFLFDIGNDLGIAYLDGRPAVRLTKSDGARRDITISPTGKAIAFTRAGNLFAASVEKPGEQQLTFDGGGDVLNAHGDWVYEEEIFNRRGRAFWWSPDGLQLAFLRFDDAPVKKYDLLNLSQLRQQLDAYPYPLPGDANPHVRIGVAQVTGGKPVYLDFGDYPVDAIVVSRVGWMPDSKAVFAYVQNRTQTWLDFVVWDTPGARPRKLFRETTKAWVEDLGQPHFLPDGSFLLTSERTGWKQIYRFAADGNLIAPVTSGYWEVHDIARVDPEEKRVYFSAAMTSPTSLDFCRATFGGPVELLTEKGMYNRVTLAPRGPLFIDRMSNPKTPPQTVLEEAGAGIVRKLETNPMRERVQGRQSQVERTRIAMKDGFELEAAITYPPDFDAAKKYPIWILTYAGPHAPTIRDEWGGGRGGQDATLAASGIVVFRVDPRSASGKGAQSAWTCYKQLGVRELEDLEEAVAWLCKKPWADASRVGISGHSYGGFMAAYALTHSKVFSAGIASGPVTDWKLYDSIYTERYMLTPKENPDGYAKSSCVAAAKNLHGKLLIMHGMMDDNVHMQNSVQLVDALQRSNKDFELMFYPQAKHGLGGPHYSKTQQDFIKRTMGVAK